MQLSKGGKKKGENWTKGVGGWDTLEQKRGGKKREGGGVAPGGGNENCRGQKEGNVRMGGVTAGFWKMRRKKEKGKSTLRVNTKKKTPPY